MKDITQFLNKETKVSREDNYTGKLKRQQCGHTVHQDVISDSKSLKVGDRHRGAESVRTNEAKWLVFQSRLL